MNFTLPPIIYGHILLCSNVVYFFEFRLPLKVADILIILRLSVHASVHFSIKVNLKCYFLPLLIDSQISHYTKKHFHWYSEIFCIFCPCNNSHMRLTLRVSVKGSFLVAPEVEGDLEMS